MAVPDLEAPDCDTGSVCVVEVAEQKSDAFNHTTCASKEVARTETFQAVNIWQFKTMGVLLCAFSGGALASGMQATIYGFFLGYLGVESHVQMSIRSLIDVPQCFVLLVGLLSDCVPIAGLQRKPYMMIGWTIAAISLLLISQGELPKPYFCQDEHGIYDYKKDPCNPHARAAAVWYAGLIFVCAIGLVIAAASGEVLVLAYSQMEEEATRGTIKVWTTMAQVFGSLVAALFVGVAMNGKEYLGTQEWTLNFNQITLVFAVLAALMVPTSWLCVQEQHASADQMASTRGYLRSSWELLRSNAFSAFLLFVFSSQFLVNVRSTAGPHVQNVWAGVKNLQRQLFTVMNTFVMLIGMWLMKTRFLHVNWRVIVAVAIVTVTVLDALPTYLTIYGVVRDQYLFLGEDVLEQIPLAMLRMVSAFMMIEMSEEGKEGLCFGIIGTIFGISHPFATATSTNFFNAAWPGLVQASEYVDDSFSFRNTVATSYAVSYLARLMALLTLPLLASQKQAAQERKLTWSRSSLLATSTSLIMACILIFSVLALVAILTSSG